MKATFTIEIPEVLDNLQLGSILRKIASVVISQQGVQPFSQTRELRSEPRGKSLYATWDLKIEEPKLEALYVNGSVENPTTLSEAQEKCDSGEWFKCDVPIGSHTLDKQYPSDVPVFHRV